MSTKYKTANRCYLIDHHSPQPPVVPLGNMNIQEYEDFFDTAGINSLMVYCKDHWGVTYYDSKVPGASKHAGVNGDWIRAVRDITAKKGIEFVAYYCIEYDEGAARRFPEWRVRRADGTPLIRDDAYAKWSLVCYQTGYREYALSQLEEIVSNYHPDALFLDIFGASLCYCENCRKKFSSAYGYELPKDEKGLQEHKKDVISFLDDNARDFLSEMKNRLKKIDPDLAITINFSCHYPNDIRSMLDYQYSEPLLRDNWFSSAYARDTAVGLYPMLAPGEASAVYNYDRPSQYICDLSSIAAQGCRVGMYSGSQHIDGTLEHEEARRLGTVYRELAKMNPYFTQTRRPVKSVGILQSDISKSAGGDALAADAILRMKRHSPHTEAILGAMMVCEHAKVPYVILPEDSVSPEVLSEYDLVILPEVYVIKPDVLSALTEYTRNGGKLLISGRSGTMDQNCQPLKASSLSELTGTRYIKEHDEFRQNGWSAYLKASGSDTFKGLLHVTTPPVSEFFIELSAEQADTLATFVLPAVACSPTEWINWWSPPPGKETGWPAITQNSYGNGTVIYLAFDYFTMSAADTYRDTGDFFCDLLRILDIRPVLCNQTSIPDILRTAFFEEDGYYQIHQISTIPSRYRGETIPVSGGSLVFRKPVTKAHTVYPAEKELPVTQEGDTWVVELPEFELQQIIICEK